MIDAFGEGECPSLCLCLITMGMIDMVFLLVLEKYCFWDNCLCNPKLMFIFAGKTKLIWKLKTLMQ